jgi:cytochrome oxidase Cu insertion factor (SCO1/SenC/PrrC family)
MMRNRLIALALLLGLAAVPAHAHDAASHAASPNASPEAAPVAATPSEEARARAYFTDLPVVTQHGQELQFFTDVLKDRVVLVSLFYTNCTGMCPITNSKLAEVQEILGEEIGKEIFIVSISLDPRNDTPEVLKDYAAKFEAGDGWLFLTGSEQDLKTITYRLGQTDPQIEAHVPYIMLGNVKIARWTKLPPNLPPAAIADRSRQMAARSAGL